jgi:ubiquitin C
VAENMADEFAEVCVTYKGTTATIPVRAASTISDLKESIVEDGSFGTVEKEMMVLLDGENNRLQDSFNLSLLGPGPSDVIRIELVMMLEVRLNREERHETNIMVMMDCDKSIAELKAKLLEQYNLPINTQSIKQSWITLDDSAVLSSLRVNGANYIELQLEVRFSLQLEVFTGVSFQLEVSDNEPVDTLYAEVNRRARVPYHRQEIVYGDRVLEMGTRISDYHVPDQATLLVNLRNYQATVFLKTLTGQTIMLTVTPRDTVAQVKAMIEQQEGIPVAKQRLIFIGNQLQDDHYFLDYRIEHESAVHLVVREGDSFEVNVRAPSGRSHVFEVSPRESVDQLRPKLRDREGIPCDIQQYFHNGQVLENNRSLLESNVISGSTLRLAIDQGRNTQIFVSMETRDTFPLWVNGSYTVSRVKRMIAEKKGVEPELQRIFFARTPLEDDQTLRDYTIESNHMLHVHVLHPPLLHFTVTLQGSEGRPLEFEKLANVRILDLKTTLSAKYNTCIGRQQLFFEGSELDDDNKLGQCGISDGSNLDLIISEPPLLPDSRAGGAVLFVKTLTGKTIMIQVNPTDTVLALKEQIQEKEGVEVAHQCLVCGGKVLDNQATVSDCGMQNQSVLHLVLRVPSQGPVSVMVQAGEQNFELTVALEDSVSSLKEMIGNRTGTTATSLVVEGVVLSEAALLSECNLKEGTTIVAQNSVLSS